MFSTIHTENIFTYIRITGGFPDSSVGKESACSAGDPSSTPGSGRTAGEGTGYPLQYSQASLVAQLVKNSLARRETWVQFLGWEDPLEKERLRTAVFWPREFNGQYRPWGHRESDTTERLSRSVLFQQNKVHFIFFIVNGKEKGQLPKLTNFKCQ